jgi:hypothetical protein
MRATHITLVLLLALIPKPCRSQFVPDSSGDPLSKEIVNRERLAWEAAKNKDKSGLAALLSEDYAEIVDDGIFDKAQILSYFGSSNGHSLFAQGRPPKETRS